MWQLVTGTTAATLQDSSQELIKDAEGTRSYHFGIASLKLTLPIFCDVTLSTIAALYSPLAYM